MNLILDTVQRYLPLRRRTTPSGWLSFNAVCCSNMGTGKDTRQRGGIIFQSDSVSYHCFNCQFKASWQPGRTVSVKFKKLLTWLAVPDDLINRCVIDAYRLKETGQSLEVEARDPIFPDRSLPRGSRLVTEQDPIADYLKTRRLDLDQYAWHCTEEEGFTNRLIIPFYQDGRCVGYTARKITDGKPKYISEQTPGYVFNLDSQHDERHTVLVCEGVIDAISIDAVALLGSSVSREQQSQIQKLDRRIVLVPDRDSAGQSLVNTVIDLGWSVSFPNWLDCKDVNDSVVKYGKLYTLYEIFSNIQHTELQIKLRSKTWFRSQHD